MGNCCASAASSVVVPPRWRSPSEMGVSSPLTLTSETAERGLLAHGGGHPPSIGGAAPAELDTAARVRRAVVKFNINAKQGIDYMIKHGLLPPHDAAAVATFLHAHLLSDGSACTEPLNKVRVGEYLGALGKDEEARRFHADLLKAYVRSFNFGGKTLIQALREWLSEFRLPGEAQVIDRLIGRFAEEYCRQNPAVFKGHDTAYVLAFSAIMLNTDLHNPGVKRKMTLDQFVLNMRGIDGGSDVRNGELQALYSDILRAPIMQDLECDVVTFFAPARQGWLLKRGAAGVQRWQKRFFVLADGCLYYFLDPKHVAVASPRCILPLENAAAVRVGKTGVQIVSENGDQHIKSAKRLEDGTMVRGTHSEFILRAKDAADADAWASAIAAHTTRSPLRRLLSMRGLIPHKPPTQRVSFRASLSAAFSPAEKVFNPLLSRSTPGSVTKMSVAAVNSPLPGESHAGGTDGLVKPVLPSQPRVDTTLPVESQVAEANAASPIADKVGALFAGADDTGAQLTAGGTGMMPTVQPGHEPSILDDSPLTDSVSPIALDRQADVGADRGVPAGHQQQEGDSEGGMPASTPVFAAGGRSELNEPSRRGLLEVEPVDAQALQPLRPEELLPSITLRAELFSLGEAAKAVVAGRAAADDHNADDDAGSVHESGWSGQLRRASGDAREYGSSGGNVPPGSSPTMPKPTVADATDFDSDDGDNSVDQVSGVFYGNDDDDIRGANGDAPLHAHDASILDEHRFATLNRYSEVADGVTFPDAPAIANQGSSRRLGGATASPVRTGAFAATTTAAPRSPPLLRPPPSVGKMSPHFGSRRLHSAPTEGLHNLPQLDGAHLSLGAGAAAPRREAPLPSSSTMPPPMPALPPAPLPTVRARLASNASLSYESYPATPASIVGNGAPLSTTVEDVVLTGRTESDGSWQPGHASRPSPPALPRPPPRRVSGGLVAAARSATLLVPQSAQRLFGDAWGAAGGYRSVATKGADSGLGATSYTGSSSQPATSGGSASTGFPLPASGVDNANGSGHAQDDRNQLDTLEVRLSPLPATQSTT